MKNLAILTVLIALEAVVCSRLIAQTNPPQITSLISTQRTGTMFVDITYNLIDPDNQGAYILVECSSDGGGTYGVPFYSYTGDAGRLIAPGNGKHVVWNAFNDWAGNYSTSARIRLIADASFKGVELTTTNPPPATNLVWIPSGSFAMGFGPNVYISRGFWMGRFELTQREYVAIMTNNPSASIGNSNLPVESVTWDEAVLYCQRLNAHEQAAGRLPVGWGYRLPTEAEWEYACRAGTTTTFYFGDNSAVNRLPFFAWYSFNSGGETHVGGGRAPNRWGLYDMYGNVQEWCSDWFGDLSPGGNVTDPQGPGPSGNPGFVGKILRGGAFAQTLDYNTHRSPRSSSHDVFVNGVSIRSVQSGFRIVLAQNP